MNNRLLFGPILCRFSFESNSFNRIVIEVLVWLYTIQLSVSNPMSLVQHRPSIYCQYVNLIHAFYQFLLKYTHMLFYCMRVYRAALQGSGYKTPAFLFRSSCFLFLLSLSASPSSSFSFAEGIATRQQYLILSDFRYFKFYFYVRFSTLHEFNRLQLLLLFSA